MVKGLLLEQTLKTATFLTSKNKLQFYLNETSPMISLS